jgi:uncharacterized protein YdeI (YjbR/CyaY-like superfamily)
MGQRDPRVDAYIANAADFARPILTHLRAVVHETCPEVEETMKWSFPHFMYHGILCSMAAFKAHCAFGFWKGRLVLGEAVEEDAMGQFGRITSVRDLPAKRVLAGYVRTAMALNRDGVKAPRASAPATAARSTRLPADFAAALARNRAALDTFDAFSPSHRREYVEWITEAKRDATRERRIEEAIRMLSEGKTRNWKYQRA